MSRRHFRSGSRCRWALCALFLAFSTVSHAGKPVAAIYSDIEITFGGQTFAFSGIEKSFSQSASGGRVVFDVTQLGTPGYAPLPQIDTSTLETTGNHWQVQSNLGSRSYSYNGTCAAETFTTTESGIVVRHLYLNCRDLDTP